MCIVSSVCMGQCWGGENGVRTRSVGVVRTVYARFCCWCVCVVFACVLVLTLFCCIALELVNAVTLPSPPLPSPPLPSPPLPSTPLPQVPIQQHRIGLLPRGCSHASARTSNSVSTPRQGLPWQPRCTLPLTAPLPPPRQCEHCKLKKMPNFEHNADLRDMCVSSAAACSCTGICSSVDQFLASEGQSVVLLCCSQ